MRRAVLFFAAVTACSLSAASVDRAGSRPAPALTTEAGWTSVRLDVSNVVGLVSAGSELYALARATGPDGFYVSTDSGRSWVARGEFDVDYPSFLQGLTAGGGTLLAWTDSSLFRSTDRGRTWTRSYLSCSGLQYGFRSIVPIAPNGFVGIGTMMWPPSPVFARSSDAGRSWTSMKLPRPGEAGLSFSVSPLNRSTMYAVTRLAADPSSCRVLRSLDGGARWRDVTGSIGTSMPIHDVAADAGAPNRVWVAAFKGLYRSDDLGTTWHRAPGLQSVWRVASDPRLPGSVLAAAVGKTWRVGGDGSAFWMTPPATGVRGVPNVLLPLEKGDLFGGTAGVFRETSATAWSESSSGLASRVVTPVAISRSDPKAAYSSIAEDGLYKSRDAGVSWTRVPDHPRIRRASALRVDPANPEVVYLASPEYGVFRSRTGGSSWTRIFEGKVDVFDLDPAAPLRLAAAQSTWDGALHVSRDGGASWSRAALRNSYVPVTTIAFGPGAVIYAGGHYWEEWGPEYFPVGFVARSEDNGQTWQRNWDKPASRVAASPAKPRRVYVLEAEGAVSVSDDCGRSWRALPARDAGGTILPFIDFAVHMGQQDRILAVKYDGAVYSWTDGEVRWTRITPIRPAVYGASIAWHPESGLALLTERTDFLRRTDLVAR